MCILENMKRREEEDLRTSKEIADKIRNIIDDKKLSQAVVAQYAGTSPSQFSRMLNGKLALSLQHVANIATELHMEFIDILTYPDKYVNSNIKSNDSTEKVSVTFEVDPQKRDYLLRLVMGDKIKE
jgi:transcriptional regulator with XRE-family HTH domain